MAAAARLDRVLPFYVDADKTPNPGGLPQGGQTRMELPNNHLQYAVTWYALAVALAVIYFMFIRRRARGERHVASLPMPLSRPASPGSARSRTPPPCCNGTVPR